MTCNSISLLYISVICEFEICFFLGQSASPSPLSTSTDFDSNVAAVSVAYAAVPVADQRSRQPNHFSRA